MVEYNKIETVFNRDTTGTKKLIRGDWRNEAVEYLKDSKWQFTEKFDGTNIRVIWDGHYISFAGRTDKSTIPQFLLEYLNNTFLYFNWRHRYLKSIYHFKIQSSTSTIPT